ncbi:hypothetical protein KKC60_04055 [Patescibacteria group bacterium]|nr:hypothetical protein [Patescibacteria group bacterium]
MFIQIALLLIVTFVNFALAIFVIAKNKKSRANLYYGYFVFSVSLWALTNAWFQNTESLEMAYVMAIFSYIAAVFIASSLLIFSFVFSGENSPLFLKYKKYRLFIFVTAALITIFTSIPHLVLKKIEYYEGIKRLVTTPGLYVYAAILIFFFIWSLVNLFNVYKDSKGIKKQQLKVMFVGLLLSILFGLFFNLILPLFGSYHFVWLGPDFAIIMVIAFGFAIVKYRLFDVQIQLQKFFNYILPFFILIPLALIAGYYFHAQLHKNPYIIGPIILVVSCLLYKFLYKRIKKASLGHFIFRSTYLYQQAIRNLARDASTILDIDKLADRIVRVLRDKVKIDKVIIVTNVTGAKTFSVLRWCCDLKRENEDNFRTLPVDLLENFSITNEPLIREELELEIENSEGKTKETLKAHIDSLKKLDAQVALPLLLQESLVGIIFLGPKEKRKAYTEEDVEALMNLAQELAIAIANSTLHQTKAKQAQLFKTEVAKQTKEIKKLYEMKSNFLTVASHQLRTPTSIIRGMLSMMAEGGMPKEKQAESIDAAFKSSSNLERVIEDILTAAEIDSASFDFTPEPVDIIPIANKVLEDLLLKAEKHEIKLELRKPQMRQALAMTSPTKIEQVFANLTDNALNYTPKGEVILSVSKEKYRSKEYLAFSCQDTGVGMTKQDIKKIGEKFFRSKNVFSVHPNGTGLGIYIVKSIIASSQGHLVIISKGLGKGSTFKVLLPIATSKDEEDASKRKEAEKEAWAKERAAKERKK